MGLGFKRRQKEGKIVLAIPPIRLKRVRASAERKFHRSRARGVPRRGLGQRIASEYKAGVRTFDGLIQGTTTAMSLQDDGMLRSGDLLHDST